MLLEERGRDVIKWTLKVLTSPVWEDPMIREILKFLYSQTYQSGWLAVRRMCSVLSEEDFGTNTSGRQGCYEVSHKTPLLRGFS
ncbi:hypothetical protein R1flu_025166 [Riccia fluitans]|uniref:Uncharacterized protein n=1 Tax=Riccia fluitans TaxID=41844 RepID=A0ABD1XWZ8_9MARC